MRTLLPILTLGLVVPLQAQEVSLPDAAAGAAAVHESQILAHTRFLSDDLLGGRGPGSYGERVALAYLAAQFESLGLEPAGTNGSWFQPFSLVRLTAQMPETLNVAGPGGRALELLYSDDWVAGAGRQAPSGAVDDAEVVFVGYGIVAPEEAWDDYKGFDARGKVLLFLNNDPSGDRFAGDMRLYYGRWTYKYEIAAEKGAAGAFIIHTTPSAGYPWQVVQSGFGGTEFELPADPAEPRVEVRGWLTEDAASRLVALGDSELDALVAAAESPDFEPVPLGVTIDLTFETRLETTPTANVVARLPGGHAELAREHVLYTAHFDHLGIGAAVDGDSIYNGARDNALGTASLLATASAFQALPRRPSRSILFAAVGAEEQGLLGSEHLATHPPVPICRIVANLNLDGGNIWGRTMDVRQIGRGKSSLDVWLDRFAAEQGRDVKPEEFPDKGYFYRSDQFNLAKVGVPALYLDEGTEFRGREPGWGADQIDNWIERHYHQPSDEVTDEWALGGAVEDVQLLFRVGYAVAEAGDAPRWSPGDEFEAARLACAP